ncbi:MAG: helix-turn-helix domain-containing protein [Eubacteriales bacterium]
MSELLQKSTFFTEGPPEILLREAEHDGRSGAHTHEFYEVVYVADGFTLHSSGGRVNMLVTGDLFFVRPGEEHSYINAYRTKLYNLLFTSDALGSELSELARLPGLDIMFCGGDAENNGTRLIHVSMNERHSVESLLEKIQGERLARRVGWQTLLHAHLVSFLIRYARMYEAQWDHLTQSSNDYYGYIYKILSYVNDNYARPITTSELAEITGLSPDYMARKFKQALNMSPAEYVRRFRIARAMELLCTSDLPIVEVARQTGFSDISLFSRVFKQAVGLPPAAYRKTIRGTRD